jgi:hypothetical protein
MSGDRRADGLYPYHAGPRLTVTLPQLSRHFEQVDEGAESVTAHQTCRSGLGPEAIAGAIRTCAAVLTADEPIGCSTPYRAARRAAAVQRAGRMARPAGSARLGEANAVTRASLLRL